MPNFLDVARRARQDFKPLEPEGTPGPTPLSSPIPIDEDEKKKIKQDIANKAGVESVDDKTLEGAQGILEGAQSVAEQGEDPANYHPEELKAEAGKAEEPESPEKIDNQRKVAMVLSAIVPTIAGYALQGYQGGAIGAAAGAQAVKGIGEVVEKEEKERKEAKEAGLKEREVAAKEKEAGVKSVDELRKERNNLPLTKQTQESGVMIEKIRSTAKSKSAAGDIAMIYSFMKLNDPGSVVREGEFATAQNATGVPDRVRNIYNKLLSGERLAPHQRQDFLTQSEKLWEAQVKKQAQADKGYIDLANKRGIDPNEVITSFYEPIEEQTQDPNIAEYAKTYNLSYEKAHEILTKRGYRPR